MTTPEALSPGVVALLLLTAAVVLGALAVRLTHRRTPGRHRARPPLDPPADTLHHATGAREFLADIPAQHGGEER